MREEEREEERGEERKEKRKERRERERKREREEHRSGQNGEYGRQIAYHFTVSTAVGRHGYVLLRGAIN